jgi:hypothetical protein
MNRRLLLPLCVTSKPLRSVYMCSRGSADSDWVIAARPNGLAPTESWHARPFECEGLVAAP